LRGDVNERLTMDRRAPGRIPNASAQSPSAGPLRASSAPVRAFSVPWVCRNEIAHGLPRPLAKTVSERVEGRTFAGVRPRYGRKNAITHCKC
jgi:hypothetical protein